MNGSLLMLNIADFRSLIPEFADPAVYTDSAITLQFSTATNYISAVNYGILNGNARLSALYNMTAHLMKLAKMAAEGDGGAAGITTEARVGNVQVVLLPPPLNDNFYQWWLAQTPYGQALLAQLKAKAVGGFWLGANVPELGSFRRGNGSFRPRGW